MTNEKTNEEIRHRNVMEEIETERKAKLEVTELTHKNRMEELKRESEYRLEVERIKSAEIRKSQERKRDREFAESYHREIK